ncbi:helix-turn-helix transcriptional regulator [Terrabacter carboxydivorans]|uniref:HTH luxR-type domain-containing protein n=1 Tax=Terrabacter carboxydivorans TaxID=619730 RepID=A0ABP5Y5W5_9MICO
MNEPSTHPRDVQRLVQALRDSGSPDDPAHDLGDHAHGPDEDGRRPELTPRQWEILREVAAGATNQQVGHRLGVSEATVRKHLEHVFERLQVASRTEAVMAVSRYLDPPGGSAGPVEVAPEAPEAPQAPGVRSPR